MRRFSNSEIQAFKRCKRKWWLQWFLGYRPKRDEQTGVRKLGTRIHVVLEHVYQPGGPFLDVDKAMRVLNMSLDADRNTLDAAQLKEFDSEADLSRAMVEGYLQWVAETGVDESLEVVSSEAYVEAELMPDVMIIGKLDVRVINTRNGAKQFLDHKTVADFNTPRMTLRQNEQMLHYLLLELLQGEQHCDAALYNMIRRVKRTARAKPPFFERLEVRHNPEELRTFRERLVRTIEDIRTLEGKLTFSLSDSITAYPRPSRECAWECPFTAVCPMFDDGSRVEDALPYFLTQGNPLSYYKEHELALKGDETSG